MWLGRRPGREADRHVRRGKGRGGDDGRLRGFHGEVAAPGGHLERARLRPAGAGAARAALRPGLPLVLPRRRLPLPVQRGRAPGSVRRHLRPRRRKDDLAGRRGADHRAARAKDGVDGSQVEGLYHAGQLEALRHYCLSDVVQTAFLFLRYRLVSGDLDRDGYRHAASAMLATLETDGRFGRLLDGLDRAAVVARVTDRRRAACAAGARSTRARRRPSRASCWARCWCAPRAGGAPLRRAHRRGGGLSRRARRRVARAPRAHAARRDHVRAARASCTSI